jgi:hypothetical protein
LLCKVSFWSDLSCGETVILLRNLIGPGLVILLVAEDGNLRTDATIFCFLPHFYDCREIRPLKHKLYQWLK